MTRLCTPPRLLHLLSVLLPLLLLLPSPVVSKKKAPPPVEDIIELVDSRELVTIIGKEEYVAVFFCEYALPL